MKEKIIQLENKEFNDRGDEHYIQLVNQIEVISANAKRQAVYSVNSALVEMNWNIGRHIIEYEQSGNMRATYGAKLIPRLSHDLTLHLGRGYSKSNLANMRLFYLNFPIFQTVFGKLTWSHWIELIGIEINWNEIFIMRKALISSGLLENYGRIVTEDCSIR